MPVKTIGHSNGVCQLLLELVNTLGTIPGIIGIAGKDKVWIDLIKHISNHAQLVAGGAVLPEKSQGAKFGG